MGQGCCQMSGSPWVGRQRVHVRDGRQRFRAASRVRVGGSPGVGGGTGPAEHAQGSGAGGGGGDPWCGLLHGQDYGLRRALVMKDGASSQGIHR